MVPLRQVSLEEIEPRIREEAVSLDNALAVAIHYLVGGGADTTETQRTRDGS